MTDLRGEGAIVAAAIVWTKAHSTSQVIKARRTLRATVEAYLEADPPSPASLDNGLRGEPGQRELDSWAAYLATGSMRKAADRLGIHEVTVRKHIAALRQFYDVSTNAQLADQIARSILR